MLVIDCLQGETITLGDNIKIKLLGMDRGEVRIGITAPSSIKIHREEIYKKVQSAKKDKPSME